MGYELGGGVSDGVILPVIPHSIPIFFFITYFLVIVGFCMGVADFLARSMYSIL